MYFSLKKRAPLLTVAFLGAVAISLGANVARAAQGSEADEVTEARKSVQMFQQQDPSLTGVLNKVPGYAVLPNIAKGAFGVGAAIGHGVVFEKGKPIGTAKLTKVTVGAQVGGQSYSELIVFQTQKALDDFKRGDFALAADASAVALSAGVSTNLKYSNGVGVITAGEKGLMYEAAVGGQRFKFEAFKGGKPGA